MGEVYQARDTKLERDVAIKVLPEIFAASPERLARFEREAKLLASLNHPNIAAIHGLEEAESLRFLVLELVPGETLAERLRKGPIPLQEVLRLAKQIAEALEAAHARGVIHRDLKPANVKVTPDGKVKVLDFGLAKAFDEETPGSDVSQSPTLSAGSTRAGVILGTAAYMSPEQARGIPVDKRTDIFSFGSLLYEMLSGRKAFGGELVSDALASVISKDGGGAPLWLRSGRHIVYNSGKRFYEVEVETEPELRPGPPRELFQASYVSVSGRNYDVSPDGERFAMVVERGSSQQQTMVIVVNWLEELKRRVPIE